MIDYIWNVSKEPLYVTISLKPFSNEQYFLSWIDLDKRGTSRYHGTDYIVNTSNLETQLYF